jgi:hypothetical protein
LFFYLNWFLEALQLRPLGLEFDMESLWGKNVGLFSSEIVDLVQMRPKFLFHNKRSTLSYLPIVGVYLSIVIIFTSVEIYDGLKILMLKIEGEKESERPFF